MTGATSPRPVIAYVYSAHSVFAYLGSAKLAAICAARDVALIHKPILLSPVVEAQGSVPFAQRTQAHADYFFGREIARWAEYRDVPIINFRPTYHDADYSLASGMIIALGEAGVAVDQMAHAILEAHWRDDADLSNPTALARIATALGHDAQSLIARASSKGCQDVLQSNTKWAQANNIFGSPTYIVDGDAFYGQDRLELVERALQKPFAAPDGRPRVDMHSAARANPAIFVIGSVAIAKIRERADRYG